jgi:hypothetical protein
MGASKGASIDLGPAVASYQKGIDTAQSGFQQSITPYIQGLTNAQLAQIDQLTKYNQTSAPYQTTNYDAMNQFRQYLGLSPLSRDSMITNALSGMEQKLNAAGPFANTQVSSYVGSLVDKAKLLENTTDPAARAALKKEISTGLTGWQNFVQGKLNDRQIVDYVRQRAQNSGGPNEIQNSATMKTMGQYGIGNNVNVHDVFGNTYSDWNDYDAKQNALRQQAIDNGAPYLGSLDFFGGKDTLDPGQMQAVRSALNSSMSDVHGILSSMDTYAPDNLPKGMTGQEITDQLKSLPNYQFNLDQGLQAQERLNAKQGNLLSGKAMIDAQNYGQNYANNVYQQQLGNLASLAGISAPISQGSTLGMPQVANQLASPYLQAGQYQGNALQGGGLAALQGYTAMGNMQGQAAIAQAQMNQQAGMGMMNSALGMLGKLF